MQLGQKLKEIRKQLGLSGNQLAKLSGIGQSTISDIENQKISPSIDTLERICDALGISLSEFFADQSELPPDILQLVEAAKKLTPKERQKITELIQTTLEVRPQYISASSPKGELRYKMVEHLSESSDANKKA
ncbi:helix-turn-helix domain-containing protein [Parageobacillus toebii]|uniref:helix-turn-helix domain-containing protein n=1 Tax=Parageobacillus toebii TaxID=153151 RepID=UPI002E1F38B3|nr:helix-turn-helix domain-containing protein [Parageobacillus toebii]